MISQLDAKLIHRKDKERVEDECNPENEKPTDSPTTKVAQPQPNTAEAERSTEPVCVKTKTLQRYRRGRRWRWRWVWKCCHELDAAKQAKQKECAVGDKSVFEGEDSNIKPGKNQKREIQG